MSCKNSNNRALHGLLLPCLLLLSACASAPPGPAATQEARSYPATFEFTGRIGVRHDGEGFSGNLNWQHAPDRDDIQLIAPLGQTAARIHRSASNVTLDTADEHYSAQNPDELTEQVLGWRLPLDGMPHWLLGRPAPDGMAEIERDDNLRIKTLRQQGWHIDYQSYRMEGNYVLPSRMLLRKDTLELKLIVDSWEVP